MTKPTPPTTAVTVGPSPVPGTLAAGLPDATARTIFLMGHELANHLMVIRLCAEFVANDPGLPETLRSDLARILESVNRAGHATAAINDLTRPRPVNLQPIAVLPLLESVRDAQAELAGDAIEVSASVEPDLPPVLGDLTELREALLALTAISIGAIRSDRSTGHIDLQADERVNASGVPVISIAIVDDGPPMPLAELTDLFSPLANGRPEGRVDGLAFAVAEDRVRRQRGLLVDEAAVDGDRGVRFQVTLPVGKEPA